MVICVVLVAISFTNAQDEVLKWNEIALQTVKSEATSPPKVSRDLAIMHVAAYDALNSIDRLCTPIYIPWQPLAGPTNRVVTVAAASHRVLSVFYPSQQAQLDAALEDTLNSVAPGAAVDNAMALGIAVADAVMLLRSTDGWDASSSYVYDPNTPGKWRPTPPGYSPPLLPHWGDVTPFGVLNPNDFVLAPPPALDSAEYAAAVNEVKEIGALNSATRTADETEIVVFWSDSPGQTASPVGKWHIISQVIAEQMNTNMLQNARTFALLGLSTADAGIVSWRAKYLYDLWRPITAIRLADTDGNPGTIADPLWEPIWPTPPFPECSSGHSSFSGAGAGVLSLIYGTNDIPFTIAAGFDMLPGVLRSYNGFWEAAEEAGMSRIYGGIHFSFSNTGGLDGGAGISAEIYNNFALAAPFTFTAGDGTPGNPYQITDIAGLQAMNINLTASYILMNDIDMEGIVFTDAVIAPYVNNPAIDVGWGNPFSGSFDGNGKVISNLTIQKTNTDLVSMFGLVATGAVIKDFGLKNVNINVDNGDYVAGIAGWCSGTIENCYVTGSISGYDRVGGIAGGLLLEGVIRNCYAQVQITAANQIAGGITSFVSITTGIIEDCYASGTVSGLFSGGLVGKNQAYPGAITESFFNTDFIASSALGVGKTTAQLKDHQTFADAGWDFVTAWKQMNGQYPVLQWEFVELSADINNDDIVNMLDFAILSSQWMMEGESLTADINSDDIVNSGDLIIMAEQWLVSN